MASGSTGRTQWGAVGEDGRCGASMRRSEPGTEAPQRRFQPIGSFDRAPPAGPGPSTKPYQQSSTEGPGKVGCGVHLYGHAFAHIISCMHVEDERSYLFRSKRAVGCGCHSPPDCPDLEVSASSGNNQLRLYLIKALSRAGSHLGVRWSLNETAGCDLH